MSQQCLSPARRICFGAFLVLFSAALLGALGFAAYIALVLAAELSGDSPGVAAMCPRMPYLRSVSPCGSSRAAIRTSAIRDTVSSAIVGLNRGRSLMQPRYRGPCFWELGRDGCR